VCHALLQDPHFFRLLIRIDEAFADDVHKGGCPYCGGALHRGNYSRKPRGCLSELRSLFESRFSFCCSQCRRRTTSRSVRFLGRRVYIALAVVLTSTRSAPAERLSATLSIPLRTLQRWAQWWQEQLPLTPFWQANRGLFIPPVAFDQCPSSLLDRFTGEAAEMMSRLLFFLSPLTVKIFGLPEGH